MTRRRPEMNVRSCTRSRSGVYTRCKTTCYRRTIRLWRKTVRPSLPVRTLLQHNYSWSMPPPIADTSPCLDLYRDQADQVASSTVSRAHGHERSRSAERRQTRQEPGRRAARSATLGGTRLRTPQFRSTIAVISFLYFLALLAPCCIISVLYGLLVFLSLRLVSFFYYNVGFSVLACHGPKYLASSPRPSPLSPHLANVYTYISLYHHKMFYVCLYSCLIA